MEDKLHFSNSSKLDCIQFELSLRIFICFTEEHSGLCDEEKEIKRPKTTLRRCWGNQIL